MERFNKFVDELRKDTDINVEFKNESKFMKFLGALLFFNKGFMSMFVTTIGDTVYFPSKEMIEDKPESAIMVMSHEYVHIKDSKRLGLLYKPMYLFPQILAVLSIFSLFAFLTPYAWLFLIFLVFLAPFYSPGRKYIELRGYQMSIFTYYLFLKENEHSDESIKKILYDFSDNTNEFFTGSAYYYMWPRGVHRELKSFVDKLINDEVSKNSGMYKVVKEAFENSK